MEKSIHTHENAVLRTLLRETREAAGATQVDLAKKLGKGQSILSKYERGEVRLDVIQLRAVCHALGTTLPAFVARLEERLRTRKSAGKANLSSWGYGRGAGAPSGTASRRPDTIPAR